ncbi:IS3 family transposase [Spirilliplanes yamanashiensis]|uniref:Transposase n=2 Tax=Spirilliplanes yamanashiensis TaxID=42233 RepID=A0A8J3YF47_9ACTN|nr:IS3 family transposase [Spirilliplanes yamanashiensis]MDP9816790.1 transposase InsO family protein [Spirilliplanes yamanashiensis]MDP9818444.1 transposase InsO family protein [Spirilliplanes yamanashiensis]GIJ06785.1 transposase [Spirilliplanes yamanashiensis]
MNRHEIYRFIAAEKTTYPVRLLCHVLGVGHSAFYAWLGGGRDRAEQRVRDDQARAAAARQAWAEHRCVYGARRLTAELHERGHRWNRKAVARLMRLAGIEGAHRRRRGKPRRRAVATATAPDLVQRRFTATAPDRLWVADISYLRTWEGFLYLAVVVDAFSRRVVGWAMADHLRTELILDAVGMAIQARRPARDQLIHHSDRGTQYTSFEFGRTLRSCGVLASMGSVADCFDNALAETFFATLKTELVYTRSWPTRHELEMEVFSYIEGFYNPRRRHSRLGNVSPATYETRHHDTVTDIEVSGR